MASSLALTEIKPFVRDILGCGCPEAVFEHIELIAGGTGDDWTQSIEIGGRLLVLIADFGASTEFEPKLSRLLQVGRQQRDRRGFNRLRIVALSDAAKELGPKLEARFARLPLADERTHLHCLDQLALASAHQRAADGTRRNRRSLAAMKKRRIHPE